MSTDPKKYAALITQNLHYETIDVYLLQRGVLSVVEYDRLRKALQSGSLTNSDVVHQILPRILKKPRDFYRALRDHVNDKPEDVHPSNDDLFYHLPESFVSTVYKYVVDYYNYIYSIKLQLSNFIYGSYYCTV